MDRVLLFFLREVFHKEQEFSYFRVTCLLLSSADVTAAFALMPLLGLELF